MADAVVEEGPDPATRFRRKVRPVQAVVDLWGARELVRALAERDLRSRYKQAAFGFLWALITPLLLMVVSTVFFQKVAKQDTGPAPYAIFSYLGTLPWSFFNTSISAGGQSLVSNNSLLNKVYCPREAFPLATIAVALVDLAIATAVLGLLFPIYRYGPTATSIWVPVALVVQIAFTAGLTFLLAGLLVYLRDLRQFIPMLLQVGLFATPVFYGVDSFPEGLRTTYAYANPLVGVIDTYRRTVLYGQAPDWSLLGPGALTATLVLIAGFLVLKRLEAGFADVA